MTASALFTFAGGIGLFLLGMRLMTDGFKQAAGNQLRQILIQATRSRLRGLVSGILITSLVQSSSAVIFATIGFVNAGLLTLAQAIGVIYGSNLGTTLTSWIVALVGVKVDVRALAMPAIGIGMALWILRPRHRTGSFGQAIAGLGLFFLGINILQEAFAGTDHTLLADLWGDGHLGAVFLLVGAGILLTTLMQSSSAALAITLTAAAGGLIPLSAAAAMVIGANVGTTSTALLATFGATASARKAAFAHVGFNLVTAVAALILLPTLLALIHWLSANLGMSDQPATLLALFHTLTKLLGVLLMWPLTGVLVNQLERLVPEPVATKGQPRHLDRNVQLTPLMALEALILELREMGRDARAIARDSLCGRDEDERLAERGQALEHINDAVAEFCAGMETSDDQPHEILPHCLRVAHYQVNLGHLAQELRTLMASDHGYPEDIQRAFAVLTQQATSMLDAMEQQELPLDNLASAEREFLRSYEAFKHQLLVAGSRGRLGPAALSTRLEQISVIKRLVEQGCKSERVFREAAAGVRALAPPPPDNPSPELA